MRSLIAAARPEGGSDAHSGFGDFGARNSFGRRPGGRPDLRPAYPVCLHVYGPITYYECSYYLDWLSARLGVGPLRPSAR